jgi:uncharacterized protein (DUF697 family)
MAYYDALISKWATLTPGTTAQKIVQVNAITVQIAASTKAILVPSAILNAIVFADLAALTQLQVTQLTLLLQGSQVDASVGTSIRAGIQALFAGKTQTLSNLGALVAPYDTPIIVPWWQATVAQGGGGLTSSVSLQDCANAGLS